MSDPEPIAPSTSEAEGILSEAIRLLAVSREEGTAGTSTEPLMNPDEVAILKAQLEVAKASLLRKREIEDLKSQLAAILNSDQAPTSNPSLNTASYSEMIGNFKDNDRSDIELEYGALQVITPFDRQRLSPSDKNRVYLNFTKGIANKFKGITTIVGLDQISTIENIMSFSQLRLELQKHIYSISAHSVFFILRFDDSGVLINPDSENGKPFNLLTSACLPSLNEIEKSTFHYFRRGTSFNQENLLWTYEAIRNSCDRELQNILDAKMLRYKDNHRFGPFYFHELISQMTTVDSKAIRAITQELSTLTVPSQDGQSIARIAKIIRSAINWLDTVRMLPPDINAIVFDILETCTVPDFQLFLKTLMANAILNGIELDHISLLGKAEEHYRTLILSKRWDTGGYQGSSFQMQRHPNPASGSHVSNNRANNRNRFQMPTWSRTAPADNEPHQRESDGKIFKWCGVCGRWFYGDRAHLTSEHAAGYRNPAQRNHQENAGTHNTFSPTLPLDSSESTDTTDRESVVSAARLSRTYFSGGL